MRRLRSLTAWLLLALWLPATLHCDLEAAGFESVFGCHEHETAPSTHCPDDLGHSIEGVSYRLDFSAVKAPAPAVALLWLLRPAAATTPALSSIRLVAEVATSPPELARTWQFTARAAPSPRAPSLVS